MKRILIFVVFCLTCCALSFAADGGVPLLPKSFAGWTQSGQAQSSVTPSQADPAYPAVLQEYGFAGSETVTYTRDDGRKLTLKVAKFNDATGAVWSVHLLSPTGDEDRADRYQGCLCE